MITSASRSMFAIAAAALVAAIGYAVVVTEHAGAAVLFFVAGAATVAGLALLGGDAREIPLDPTAVAAPPNTDPSRPSVWPLLSALTAAVLAVGLAVGPALVVPAVPVFLLALAGWLGHSWVEHPSWDGDSGQRVVDRLIAPVALPVGTVLLIGVIVVSFSRVLLATSKTASTIIALLAAVLVLGACSLIAVRPPKRSSALVGLSVVAALLTVSAGVGGAVAGEREFHHIGDAAEHGGEAGHDDGAEADEDHAEAEDEDADASTHPTTAADPTPQPASGSEPALTIKADALAFNLTSVSLPAGQPIALVFENAEPVPHNVAIYRSDGTAQYKGEIVTGPTTVRDTIPAMAAGSYELRCDVHPTQMKGSVAVV